MPEHPLPQACASVLQGQPVPVPGLDAVQVVVGVLEAQRGRFQEALALIDRALILNPQSIEAYISCANVLKATDRHEEALASCDKALAIEPGTTSAGLAKSGTQLNGSPLDLPAGPSAALNPLGDAVAKLSGVDAGDVLTDVKRQLIPVLGELEATFADISTITNAIGGTGESLGNIGHRTKELIETLSDHSADLDSIIQSLSILPADISNLINQNLDQVNDIVDVATQLTTILADNTSNLNAAMAAAPGIVSELGTILNEFTAAFTWSDHNAIIVGSGANILTIGQALGILEGTWTPPQ